MSKATVKSKYIARPILFSGPMVRAILNGRKTQTRRVISLPSTIECGSLLPESGYKYRFSDLEGTTIDLGCPYGRPPVPLEPLDRLWVRETFIPYEHPKGYGVWFAADRACYSATFEEMEETVSLTGLGPRLKDPASLLPEADDLRKKPAIFMPRWASRITLDITGIRVERVQEISGKDAEAEGIERIPNIGPCAFGWKDYSGGPGFFDPRESYRTAWDSINAKRGFGWELNPWVWILEFRRSK